MNRLLKLLILGPPGSGKGTLGKRVAEMFDLKHLASGDILRDHVTRRTPIGSEACNFIEQGKVPPSWSEVKQTWTSIISLIVILKY